MKAIFIYWAMDLTQQSENYSAVFTSIFWPGMETKEDIHYSHGLNSEPEYLQSYTGLYLTEPGHHS